MSNWCRHCPWISRCRLSWLAAVLSLGWILPAAGNPPPAIITNTWTFGFTQPDSRVLYNSSTATPAIGADGTLYVGSFDGAFFAVSPEGKLKWRYRAGREIQSSAAIGEDGTIYFGARDRKLYALTPSGKLKWSFPTGGWVDSSPAIGADGTICFGSWDGTFYALTSDGNLKWKFAAGGIVDSSPAIAADGTIYFGSHDNNFYALNPDGRARWSFPTGGGIISSPAIGSDGAVYFSSLDGFLYALNPDGTMRWRTHTGGWSASSPVLDEAGRIYICAGPAKSFDRDGRLLWSWYSDADLGIAPAAVRAQIFVPRNYNALHSLTGDRELVWQAKLPFSPTSSLVVGQDGTVYASCVHQLCACRPPQPLPPAASSWPMFRANARHTGRVAGR